MNKRGMALLLVLATLLIAIIFANIILSLMSSQSTLTQHQIRRIQAYYASQAGINYALEALRLNDINWVTTTSSISHYICRSNTGLPPCDAAAIVEPDLSRAINYVLITVDPLNPTYGNRTVTATANYTSN